MEKLKEIKEILSNKIKTMDDFYNNKDIILTLIEEIELLFKQNDNNNITTEENNYNNKNNINKDINNENVINNKDEIINEKDNYINENNINSENKSETKDILNDNNNNECENDNNNDYKNKDINTEEEKEESESHSLPKLNFDYDKNINEILNDINIDQNKPFHNINNENKDNIELIKHNEINPLNKNGYSDLFSFNQDLSNINNRSSFTTEDFTSKKKNIKNNDKENNNIKTSKALRVADIIMKINSNDILYDIITQLYTKDILDQLMSPDADIELINVLEQTIEKIILLENEEIQKLRKKELSITDDTNNNNMNIDINNDELNNINNNNKKHINNVNNYNRLNIPKKNDDYKKYNSSSSFYAKNNNSNNNSIHIKSNVNNFNESNIKINGRKKISKAEHLNSEILQNYPKTGKSILGYERYKREKNREFNFENSLRNDENKSYYSLGNKRSFSQKKNAFNNYTSPFGDYFDSSLQKGGQSKLRYPLKKNESFKNCRSPVKDYIDGIYDIYI